MSQQVTASFYIDHPYTGHLWHCLTGKPEKPQEKSLKIGLISDFQLVHVGVMVRALGLAHIPEKGTSEALQQPSPKNPDETLEVQQHHSAKLTHGPTRGISKPVVKIYTRLTHLNHREKSAHRSHQGCTLAMK